MLVRVREISLEPSRLQKRALTELAASEIRKGSSRNELHANSAEF